MLELFWFVYFFVFYRNEYIEGDIFLNRFIYLVSLYVVAIILLIISYNIISLNTLSLSLINI